MKNYYFLLAILFATLAPHKSFSKENWEFVKDAEYCYIQSSPIKTVIPEGKLRGEHALIVYRLHKSPKLIIQITAGYNYKTSESIIVKIDDESYNLYSDEDTAWAVDEDEDKKTIYAMKKGLEFIAVGISSKNTKVIDTYSLNGFTSAVNKLTKDC